MSILDLCRTYPVDAGLKAFQLWPKRISLSFRREYFPNTLYYDRVFTWFEHPHAVHNGSFVGRQACGAFASRRLHLFI